MKRIWLVFVFALASVIAVSAQPGKGGANPPSTAAPIILDYLVDPNTVVYSRAFSEWDAEWQQWAYSIPVAKHPLFDNGDCSVGNAGPVWFLGGKFCPNVGGNCDVSNVQRSCTIPYGKMLYFPVSNGEDSALEQDVCENPGNIDTQQIGYLRGYSPFDHLNDPFRVQQYVKIDGVTVPHLENRLVQSVAFGFTIPDDNYLKAVYPPECSSGFKAGTYFPAVDNGTYLMLKPLPPGFHVIKFGAFWPDPNGGTGWGFNMTYNLNVVK